MPEKKIMEPLDSKTSAFYDKQIDKAVLVNLLSQVKRYGIEDVKERCFDEKQQEFLKNVGSMNPDEFAVFSKQLQDSISFSPAGF